AERERQRQKEEEAKQKESESKDNTPSNNGSDNGNSDSNETSGTTASTQGSGNAMFSMPTSGSITSGFGSGESPGGIGSTSHNGVDCGAAKGTAVTAPASGVVTLVTTGCTEGDHGCGGGYGNYIIVTHYIDGKSYDTLYGHLSSVNVSNGQSVSKV